MDISEIIKKHAELEEEIYTYFGYIEQWKVFPFDYCLECYWRLTEDSVIYAPTIVDLLNQESEDYYSCDFFTSTPIYKGDEYTMICVDTRCDGNKFLSIFDNKKLFNRSNIDEYKKVIG